MLLESGVILMKTLGSYLKSVRGSRSLDYVAQVMGSTKSYLSKVENGLRHPRPDTLYKISKAYDADINTLISLSQYPESEKLVASEIADIAVTSNLIAVSDFGKEHPTEWPTKIEIDMLNKYRALTPELRKAVRSVLDAAYTVSALDLGAPESEVIQLPYLDLPAAAGSGTQLDEWCRGELVSFAMDSVSCRANYAVRVAGDSMEPDYSDGDIVGVAAASEISRGDVGLFTVDDAGYIKKLGDTELESINPAYENIKTSAYSAVRCCGRVIGKLKKGE